MRRTSRWQHAWAAVDKLALLYGVLAFGAVLFSAGTFVASLKWQLFLSAARSGFPSGSQAWSAPLDDVFIHFDFARSAARGAPFEWALGNGYSSGSTSVVYPLVLALGYLGGFQGTRLMLWALVVACLSTFVTLLMARRLFRGLHPASAFLLPPLLLSVGGLNWSLWSGMEVAWLLGVWAIALRFWDDCVTRSGPDPLGAARSNAAPSVQSSGLSSAWWLGVASALLVATRPEALVTALIFAGTASASIWLSRVGRRGDQPVDSSEAVAVLWRAALPSLAVVATQALINRLLTGSSAAAGALAKLELYDPLLSRARVFELWQENFAYQFERMAEYQLGDVPWTAWVLCGFALLGLCGRTTRRAATLLWLQAVGWAATVALNGRLIWHNDRYTMPALAWFLVASALGVGQAFEFVVGRAKAPRLFGWQQARALVPRICGSDGYFEAPDLARASKYPHFATDLIGALQFLWHRFLRIDALERVWRGLALSATVAALAAYAQHQAERYRDQVWFFGRAARNIHDQQLRTGQLLRSLRPVPRRVLVGDAGAIPYGSDLPAFDLIGLGGYRDLPIAQAGRWGVGAALELVERLPVEDRPDVFALYPSWWGDFPLWFGEPLFQVPARGNVICGGPSKVVYRADWRPIDEPARPFHVAADERVVDRLDVADVVSEAEHDYALAGTPERVDMKLLPIDAASGIANGIANGIDRAGVDPLRQRSPLWDAGRSLTPGAAMRFQLSGFEPNQPVVLVLRSAPTQPAVWRVSIGVDFAATIELNPSDGWQESRLELPPEIVAGSLSVTLAAETGEASLFHLWAMQRGRN